MPSGIHSKNAAVAVESHLEAELEGVRSLHVGKTLPELKQVSHAACGGAGGRVERLIKAVGESDGGLDVIGRNERRGAADVAEGSLGGEIRRNGAAVMQGRVALVVEKMDGEAGIDRGLVGIGQGAVDVVEREAREN